MNEKIAEARKELTKEKKVEIEKFIKENGWSISPFSYFFVSLQIAAKGWEGIPYRDYKTLKRWNSEGKRIKKGEKSQISGLTWITPTTKNDNGDELDSDYCFPKEYHLFGRHQLAA